MSSSPITYERRSGSYDLVTIAASAGGVEALQKILRGLPSDFPVPIVIVLHRSPREQDNLASVLGRSTPLAVKIVEHAERLRPGTAYVAPADHHVRILPGLIASLSDGARIRHVRSSANPLFSSAAEALTGRVLAVVLTGYDSDATNGVQSVHARGGTVLAQDEATAEVFEMPRSAIRTGCVNRVMALGDIAPELVRLVTGSEDEP